MHAALLPLQVQGKTFYVDRGNFADTALLDRLVRSSEEHQQQQQQPGSGSSEEHHQQQ
jgi:hypothetical protein